MRQPGASGARIARGRAAYGRGVDAEALACAVLVADGWEVLGRRLRTPAGEIDIVARRHDLVAFIEVKARASLAGAAWSLTGRQQRRLLLAAEVLLASHPEWGGCGLRFDVILVSRDGAVRRIQDALRDGGPII